MLYLKLRGRIAVVTARVLNDKIIPFPFNDEFVKKVASEEIAHYGEEIFTESGLLTGSKPEYQLELVEIEGYHLGETLLKFIHIENTNMFFLYPAQYGFKNNEYIVYAIGEYLGSVYCPIDGLDFQDFDIRDLYIGELQLDGETGYGGLIDRVYYIPINDAMDIAGAENENIAREHVANLLKKRKDHDLRYYRLKIDVGEDFSRWYYVIRNKDGELYNNWLT